MNHILCPECFALAPAEEKSCAHGCGAVTCVQCGKRREPNTPFWHCLGTEQASEEPEKK